MKFLKREIFRVQRVCERACVCVCVHAHAHVCVYVYVKKEKNLKYENIFHFFLLQLYFHILYHFIINHIILNHFITKYKYSLDNIKYGKENAKNEK